jgi:Domain of unknown function (DUF4440)
MKRHATIATLIMLAMATLGFAQGAENKNVNATAAKPKMSKKAIERALIAKEKALWEAVKRGDIKSFKKDLTADYAGVYEDGIHTVETDAQQISGVKMRSYALSDIKVTLPTADTAIMTYKVNSQGDYQGQDFSGDYICSSVWVNRGGKWVAVMHSEARAAKTP